MSLDEEYGAAIDDLSRSARREQSQQMLSGNPAKPTQAKLPAADTEYAAAMDAIADDARANVRAASLDETNPETFAKAEKLGAPLGLPASIVEGDMASVERDRRASDIENMLSAAPELQDWYLRDDNHRATKPEDIKALTGLRWLLQAVPASYGEGERDVELSELRFRQVMGQALPDDLAARADDLSRRPEADFGQEGWLQEGAVNAARMLPMTVASILGGAQRGLQTGMAFGAGAAILGQAGPQVALPEELVTVPAATAAGYAVGATAGSFEQAAKLEAGLAYDEFRQIKAADGRPLDDDVARAAAMVVGAANGALEVYGLRKTLGQIPGMDQALGMISRQSMKQALAVPSVQAALKGFTARYAQGFAAETITEMMQEAVTIFSGEVAKAVSDGSFDAMGGEDIATRIAQTGVETAKAMTFMALPGPSGRLVHDVAAARRANNNMAVFQALGENASENGLRDRLPLRTREAVNAITADGPVENVYINGDTLTTLFQSANVQPSDLVGVIPDLGERILEAKATGGDVAIPLAEYYTALAGTPLHQQLSEHLKFHPGEMSYFEAQNFNASWEAAKDAAFAQAETEIAATEAKDQPAEEVFNDVAAKAEAAGIPADQARTYATLYRAFFRTMAERTGQDALALYDQYGFDVQRVLPGAEGQTPATLQQDALPAIDTPEFKAWFGDSKTVDAEGNPLVVYHGTDADFEAFSPEASPGGVTWFTSNRASIENGDSGAAGNRRVMELFASIKNPAGWREYEQFTTDELIRDGYDGVILPNDDGSFSGFVFNPTQLKSVNNRGTFDPNDARILNQAVYHGTPHEFDAFSNDAIGTGEGAQAFGYGLYFTSKRAIAEWYRTKLSRDPEAVTYNGKAFFRADGQPFNVNEDWRRELRALLKAAVDDGSSVEELLKAARQGNAETGLFGRIMGRTWNEKLLKLVEDKVTSIGDVKKGRIYKVEIPDDGEYLLWDKNLNEQPKEIRKKLATLGIGVSDDALSAYDDALLAALEGDSNAKLPKQPSNPTGEELYRKVATGASQKWASQRLLEAGIKGIKYLDGMSRGGGNTDRGAFNYVLFDATEAEIKEFYQDARGSIQLAPGQTVINLFQNADLSTFLHESGHFFMEVTRDLASRPDAPQQMADDWATIKRHFKIGDDGVIPVDAHEEFARSFEAYLFEGKAPSEELRGVFARFRAWLLYVYRSIKALNVNVSNDIVNVFDRMLAADDEIAQAERMDEYRPMIRSAAEGGLTVDEFAAYMATVGRSNEQAREYLERQMLEAVQREETEQYRKLVRETRETVSEELRAQPAYQSWFYLASGEMPKGFDITLPENPKLDREAVIAAVGEEGFKTLPRAIKNNVASQLANKIGSADVVDLDTVASAFGFQSGSEMLFAVSFAKPFNRAVNEETVKRMQTRYPDLYRNEAVRKVEANFAMHNDQRALVLATELRALSRRVSRGSEALPVEAAKRIAQTVIARKRLGDATRYGQYARAEIKAARDAEAALIAGDFEAAANAKRRQLLNHALVREAKAASDTVERGLAYMKRMAIKPPKTVDGEYRQQIMALLDRFDLTKVSEAELQKRTGLLAWVQGQEDAGNVVNVPDYLLEEANRKSWKTLTLEEFTGLRDTVQNIAQLGKLKKTLKDAQARRDFDDVRSEIVDTIYDNNKTRDMPEERNPTKWQKFKAGVRGLDASLLKIEQVIDWLDGGNINGPMHRFVWQPLADAQARENDLHKDITAKIMAAFDRMPDEQRADLVNRIHVPEIGQSFLKSEIVAIALNTGNESNLDKMVRGEGWNMDQVSAALAHLTEADWKLVQDIWDTLETLWPQIADLQKRLTGVEPERVIPRTVETRFGAFRGGYYPVVYDPARTHEVEKRADAGDAMFENSYMRPVTKKGHTIQRAETYAKPLFLSMDVIARHVAQVSHDIAFREAVVQADKILQDASVRKAITETLSPEVYKQFRPWLQNIANDRIDRRGMNDWDNLLAGLRTNTTLMAMGYRISTMLAQTTGFAQAIELLGASWMAKGMRATLGSPSQMGKALEFVMERSGEMRHRHNTMERDVRQAVQSQTKDGGPIDQVRRFAFYGIGMVDRMVSVPVWYAGYLKHLSSNVGDEAGAIAAGDHAVRMTQGSGSAKDLAAIQRGGEGWKLFTMFYSYFSVLYNRLRDIGRTARYGDMSDVPHLVARSFWLVVVPSILGELVTGKGPDEDKEEAWLTWALKKIAVYPFLSIPVVRDVVGALASDYGYQFTPMARAVETNVKLAQEMIKMVDPESDADTARLLKLMAEEAGYVFGLPLGQVTTTASNLWEGLNNGDLELRDLFFSRQR